MPVTPTPDPKKETSKIHFTVNLDKAAIQAIDIDLLNGKREAPINTQSEVTERMLSLIVVFDDAIQEIKSHLKKLHLATPRPHNPTTGETAKNTKVFGTKHAQTASYSTVIKVGNIPTDMKKSEVIDHIAAVAKKLDLTDEHIKIAVSLATGTATHPDMKELFEKYEIANGEQQKLNKPTIPKVKK